MKKQSDSEEKLTGSHRSASKTYSNSTILIISGLSI